MDTPLKSEIREEGSGASVKVEGLSKAALIKSLSPRVMLSNHLLPKGTKMKVNLEDQGRQKVSFSFSQTKKPLHSLFIIPTSPDKSATETHSALSQSTPDKGCENTENKTENKQTHTVPTSAVETPSQPPVSSANKLKTDLAKMHFKKQILSVSVTEDKPSSVVPEEPPSTESIAFTKSTSKTATEFPTPQPQNLASVCPSENSLIEAFEKRVASSLKKPVVSSGKDGEISSSTESENKTKIAEGHGLDRGQDQEGLVPLTPERRGPEVTEDHALKGHIIMIRIGDHTEVLRAETEDTPAEDKDKDK
ncbi:uncharacterized protein ACBR49_005237 [Aulostomus maculatus]